MFGIPLIDVPFINTRYARSALPNAPVLEDEKKRRVRSGRARRTAVGSRHGWVRGGFVADSRES
jgi:hypothetical protein